MSAARISVSTFVSHFHPTKKNVHPKKSYPLLLSRGTPRQNATITVLDQESYRLTRRSFLVNDDVKTGLAAALEAEFKVEKAPGEADVYIGRVATDLDIVVSGDSDVFCYRNVKTMVQREFTKSDQETWAEFLERFVISYDIARAYYSTKRYKRKRWDADKAS
ncbi:hypothetical protein SeMB42_g06727 [Synchytrium endobioticum]|uniref:XPG-I domain-containing protein n=1 Tax=Synchytrium endobioticum TaxID=286115 RepID=A0A507CJJ3_9FUNG|nr:hypothetical protein SeMB42_g06727 [Synchytrium endobioticum]